MAAQTFDPAFYSLKSGELSQKVNIAVTIINRWRGYFIVPEALAAQNPENNRWYYHPTAAEWVNLGQKVLRWKAPEQAIGRVFRKAIANTSNDLPAALECLKKAYDAAKDFNEFEALIDKGC
ncbi:MAG: hypothetical protein SF162_06120 [bacterium]|nr:hypothetical protein [bacterium]